jgi:antitoxin MazE
VILYRTYMRKKLSRTGNSVALVLDKELLEATGLEAGSPVEVSTDGRVIVIAPPTSRKRAARLEEILGKLDRRYGAVFKKLSE